jgi:hydroxymethylpyrimidine/phosphomethylpyrimidine kinase
VRRQAERDAALQRRQPAEILSLLVHPKAPSRLRSAGAVQDAPDSVPLPKSTKPSVSAKPPALKAKRVTPVALTIAGSDSGGGAGIQADLKTFMALGLHGTCAITCLTAQNPRGVSGIQAATPQMVRRQIETVFAELPPRAVKMGMLFSTPIIRVVAEFFSTKNRPPLVVDPVMVATSGARLLKPSAIRALLDELLPLAALVTPNLDEAEILVGHPVRSLEAVRAVAREIHARFGCAALVKGGHLREGPAAVDFFFDGKTELMLSAPFVQGVSTHGTGCTYSAAVCGHLALGRQMPEAVTEAKHFITAAIAGSLKVGEHWALNPSASQPSR